jgi:hypothetical protein
MLACLIEQPPEGDDWSCTGGPPTMGLTRQNNYIGGAFITHRLKKGSGFWPACGQSLLPPNGMEAKPEIK